MIVPLHRQVILLSDARSFKKAGFPQESLFCYYEKALYIRTEIGLMDSEFMLSAVHSQEISFQLTREQRKKCLAAYTWPELRVLLSPRQWSLVWKHLKAGYRRPIFPLINEVSP